jgi:NitT/TauT family transport system substrate-binding protein
MRKTFVRYVFICIIIALVISGCASQATQQPTASEPPAEPAPTEPAASSTEETEASGDLVKLTVSILPFLSYAPVFIALEEGYFAEQGFDVEFVRIDKTSEAMPALAQGQIDVASGFFDVSTLNAIAQGGDIRYVSDKGFLDPNGCSASTFVVRKDLLEAGTLDDLKNIKGMKVALTPASSAEYALDVLLKDVGLSSSDVEILNIPLPARLEGMGNKSVDIAAVSDPWTLRIVNAGYGEVWNPWEKLMPDFQFSINMYGPNFLKKNPEFGKKYMMAYLKGVRQYNEGKTPRNIEIIAKHTQMEPSEVEQSCWMSMRDDGMIDIAGMSGFQEWAIAKGLQIKEIPPEDLLDLSFVESANEALK